MEMNYDGFVEKTKDFPVFGNEVLTLLWTRKDALSLQVNRWVRKGRLIRLKRGLYTLPEGRREVPFSMEWLTNTLYSPSYLSLESVLSRYDLIPERVSLWTSVSTRKTKEFKNPFGRFTYRHLKGDLFFGFEERKDEFGRSILVARPEKAILDLLYLKRGAEPTKEFFEGNLRLQQLDQLKKGRLKEYARRFGSKKMETAVRILLKMAS